MKISIITATYNASATIQSCLESLSQQLVPFEHLVIDGLSQDTTVQQVAAYPGHPVQLLSEADGGIYEAMNKGLQLASGDIIGFLNADDFYPDKFVLSRVHDALQDPAIGACYGDLCYVDQHDLCKIVRYWHSGAYRASRFYWGWMPPHPTFFVRRQAYLQWGGFNLDLGSAADYELMLRFLLKHSLPAVYIPEILVNMRVGGISNASLRNRLYANYQDRQAWRVNDLTPYPWTVFCKPLRKIRQWLVRPQL